LCGVVPMEVNHVLLGRSWQYDRHVHHDGLSNKFTFKRKGRTYSLKPVTPKRSKKRSNGDEASKEKLKVKIKKKRQRGTHGFSYKEVKKVRLTQTFVSFFTH